MNRVNVIDIKFVSIIKNILGKDFILEKRLYGREFSAMAFCDGGYSFCTPFIQDYKKLNNYDEGPNTGGMGAIGPIDWVPNSIRRKVKYIMQKTLEYIPNYNYNPGIFSYVIQIIYEFFKIH